MRILFLLMISWPTLSIARSLDDLVVFVGKKISVTPFRPERNGSRRIRDAAFKANYEVLNIIHGDFDSTNIEFEVYDHYGRPAFSHYETVLLFVSKVEDKIFHEKYQYFPVFQTEDGYWAGCGSPYSYEPEVHHGNLRPSHHKYRENAFFSLKNINEERAEQHYEKEYYLIKDNKAHCLKGNTAQELFQVKLNGVLDARGIK